MNTTYNVTLLNIDCDTGCTVDVHEDNVTISNQDEENGYIFIHIFNKIENNLPKGITRSHFTKDLSGWTLYNPVQLLFWKIILSFESES